MSEEITSVTRHAYKAFLKKCYGDNKKPLDRLLGEKKEETPSVPRPKGFMADRKSMAPKNKEPKKEDLPEHLRIAKQMRDMRLARKEAMSNA